MANSLGNFELNHTGNAYAKNDDDVVVAYANYEGTATGFGTIMGTLAFPLPEQGATSGTVTWTGQGFPPDREPSTSFGEGTWKQVEGSHAWQINVPVIEISDGTSLRSEGVVDLEAKTFNGQMFEA
jgi:hypothetical protein